MKSGKTDDLYVAAVFAQRARGSHGGKTAALLVNRETTKGARIRSIRQGSDDKGEFSFRVEANGVRDFGGRCRPELEGRSAQGRQVS